MFPHLQKAYQVVADARTLSNEEGSNASFFFALLKTLAEHWDEDFEKVFFMTDKDQNCRDVAVPHLVIQDRNYGNICLFIDRTLVFGQLSLSSAIPTLIAAHYMANLCYEEKALVFMTFLQQEVCDLGRLEKKRGEAKKIKNLSVYQNKKSKIVVRMYRGMTRINAHN
jgi:hypothetical protein